MNDLKNNFFEIYSPEIKEFSKYSYILIPDSNIKNLNKVYSLIDINKYNILIFKNRMCAAKLEKIPSEYLLKDEIEVSAILRFK